MNICVILKWDGNRWVLEGSAFVNPELADHYCSKDDFLKHKKVTLDVTIDICSKWRKENMS